MTTTSRPRKWYDKVRRERRRLTQHPDQAVCWLCGQPINMQLPPSHEMAFTLDHITPLARGGQLLGETKPAHRKCNSSRGKGRTTTNTQTLIQW